MPSGSVVKIKLFDFENGSQNLILFTMYDGLSELLGDTDPEDLRTPSAKVKPNFPPPGTLLAKSDDASSIAGSISSLSTAKSSVIDANRSAQLKNLADYVARRRSYSPSSTISSLSVFGSSNQLSLLTSEASKENNSTEKNSSEKSSTKDNLSLLKKKPGMNPAFSKRFHRPVLSLQNSPLTPTLATSTFGMNSINLINSATEILSSFASLLASHTTEQVPVSNAPPPSAPVVDVSLNKKRKRTESSPVDAETPTETSSLITPSAKESSSSPSSVPSAPISPPASDTNNFATLSKSARRRMRRKLMKTQPTEDQEPSLETSNVDSSIEQQPPVNKPKELELSKSDFQTLTAEQQESLSNLDTVKSNRKLRRLMKRLQASKAAAAEAASEQGNKDEV